MAERLKAGEPGDKTTTPGAPAPAAPAESRADVVQDRFTAPVIAEGIDVQQKISGPWGNNANITVMLHGHYDEGNRAWLTEVIRSWRRALPGAQVGMAASQIDQNLTEAERDLWRPEDVERADDRRVRLIRQMQPEVDFLVESHPAGVLPPLKFDDKANNCNKMIGAVQAGLSAVDTRWVLRIREDAYIQHPARMGADYEAFARHIGTPKAFRQPVAISPYYTINPFGLERMSFHVSDWYNLGLTEDVADYWNVAPMSFGDATYFEGMPHAPHTNRYERPMRARMPPEMLIATTFAARHGYRVPHYFNETGYESDALAFMRDNFVMPDPDVIGMGMEKYRKQRNWVLTGLLVISPAEWKILMEGGEPAFRAAIRGKERMIRLAEIRRRMLPFGRIRRSKVFRSLGWMIRG